VEPVYSLYVTGSSLVSDWCRLFFGEPSSFLSERGMVEREGYTDQDGLVPLASGRIGGSVLLDDAAVSCSDVVELLLVSEEVSGSSGMVANFFRTCLSAGRRIGLL
jgi:hypothetical protein